MAEVLVAKLVEAQLSGMTSSHAARCVNHSLAQGRPRCSHPLETVYDGRIRVTVAYLNNLMSRVVVLTISPNIDHEIP